MTAQVRKMTILEALAEIRLNKKKIKSAQAFVFANAIRLSDRVDPLQDKGGSAKVISQTLQSIQDLFVENVKIRNAIDSANMSNEITVEGETHTLHVWLIMKRETLPARLEILEGLFSLARGERNTFSRSTVTASVLAHFDEVLVLEEINSVNSIIERLDGAMTLADASIIVEF